MQKIEDIIDTRDLAKRRNEARQEVINYFIEIFDDMYNLPESLSYYHDYKDADYDYVMAAIKNKESEDGIIRKIAFDVADLITEIDEIDEIENCTSEFVHGETLIHEDYFEDYCYEQLVDCGYIPKDFPSWIEIDMKKTADNMSDDYQEVEYLGETYLMRN